MGIFSLITGQTATPDPAPAPVADAQKAVSIEEATASEVATYAFTHLSGARYSGSGRMLPEQFTEQALRDSMLAYESHGLAYMIIARMVAIIFEAGFEYQLSFSPGFPPDLERRIRRRLAEFFYSEDADLQARAEEFVLETLISGEHGWRLWVNPANGSVSITDVCRDDVKDLAVDARDARKLRAVVVTKRDERGIAQNATDMLRAVEIDRTGGMHDGFLSGDVLYMRLDTRASKRRGSPILQRVIDELRNEKDFRIKSSIRTLNRMATNMTVTYDGASMEQLRELAAAEKTPSIPNNHVWYQNERMKREFLSASIEAGEIMQMHRGLVTIIAGAMGMPLSWFGFGDGSNRSTAETQQEPAAQNSRRVKRGFIGMWEKLLYYAVDQMLVYRVITDDPRMQIETTDKDGERVMLPLRECITITVAPKPMQEDEPGTAPLAATTAAVSIIERALNMEDQGVRLLDEERMAVLMTHAAGVDGTRMEMSGTDVVRTTAPAPTPAGALGVDPNKPLSIP